MNTLIKDKEEVITYKEIGDRHQYFQLLKAVERGEIYRIQRGVYMTPISLVTNMIDVEKIVPRGVVCLYNAWAYYQLTTTIPPAFCVAIEAKRRVTPTHMLPISLYYWKTEYLEFGVTQKTISGKKVRITDLERSVCDAIRYRNKIGMETCVEIVKNYLKREDRNISLLTIYSKKLRISKTLDNFLELFL